MTALKVDPRAVRPVSFGLFKFLRDLEGKSNRGLRVGDVTDDEVIEAIMSAPDHFTALVITVANMIPVAGYGATRLAAAVALTAGQCVYADSTVTPNVWRLGDANLNQAASGVTGGIVGITLHAALTGQPATVITTGSLAFGAILTKGLGYVMGAVAAGDIAPETDLASGWWRTELGYATSTTVLQMAINITGQQLA